jgi:hypothetical protein
MTRKTTTGIVFTMLFILVMVSVACEQERTQTELIESLEGRWVVEEDSQYGKTTYDVYISISSSDSSHIYIADFYELNDEVEAEVNGYRLDLLPNQTITMGTTSYTIVSGSGTVSDDYRNIQWQYKVDDGSGEIDDVSAVYTKD